VGRFDFLKGEKSWPPLPFPTASPEPTFRCQISLDKQKQPPYTSTQQKQLLIQKNLKQKNDLLDSIPGIGKVTIPTILA